MALINRARMTTATTGTGTVTLGSSVTGYATFAEAGAQDADTLSYVIEDGTDFEIGTGTYTASGTTFSRDTVYLSKISGTAGTSKINLSGNATIFVSALAEELIIGDVGNTDHAIVRTNGTDGYAVQGSAPTIDDSGNVSGVVNLTQTGYHDLTEIAEPASPASNVARTYAVDDGSGVTTLEMKDSAGNVVPLSHFTQSGTGAVTRTRQNKQRDILNAADFGFATGASAATNKTALDAAVTEAAVRGGAIIELPAGVFDVNELAEISANGVSIIGAGMFGGTTLRVAAATTDFITISGQHCSVQNLYLTGSQIKASDFYAIKLDAAFHAVLRDIRIDYLYNGIHAENGSSSDLSHILLRYLLGTNGVFIAGTNGNGLFGLRCDKLDCDNPYPQTYGPVETWTTSTAFSLNDIIRVNGAIWQCSTGGTSAGAGSGPSGVPGTTGENAFTTPVADGTAAWRFVCHEALTWFTVDNYAYSTSLDNAALINGWKGFQMIDSAASGSSFPIWFNSHSLEIDHPFDNCVSLTRGEGFYMTQGWLGSSLTQRGVIIDSNFRGETHIGAGTRIVGNWSDGILLQSGPTATQIQGAQIALNSQAGSGTFHGINIGSGADDFVITANIIGKIATGSGQQGYGVFVAAGASDYYIISSNLVEGNATGGVIDGASGANSFVGDNVPGASAGGGSGAGALIAIIEDQKTQNTDAGTFTSGGDRIRVLNTLVFNRDTTVSLSSNQFTLPAGDWEIEWSAPAVNVDYHQSWLHSVTAGAAVARGDSARSEVGSSERSNGITRVSIGASTTYEIRHRCTDTRAEGLGEAANFGTEVYTRVVIRTG